LKVVVRRPALAAAALLAPHAHAGTAAYHFIDLGKLSWADSVNAHRQVAGIYQYSPAVHAADGWHILAENVQGSAVGLDATGNAAGNVNGAVGTTLPYYWPASGGQVPIPLPHGTQYHSAVVYGVGEDGTVVGSVGDGFGTTDCFLWRAGASQMRVLPTGHQCWPHSIADRHLFAGTGADANAPFSGAFLWDGTQFNWLTGLGGISSEGLGVNKAGVVVGWAWTPVGSDGKDYVHAVLWADASTAAVDLGTLPGKLWSQANAINSSGVIVGYSSDIGRQNLLPFVYSNGVMTDLNTLVDNTHGMLLTTPNDINDKGVIVGTDEYKGAEHAWMLVPIAQ
jgi:probable HAF family extracellular repeat protein